MCKRPHIKDHNAENSKLPSTCKYIKFRDGYRSIWAYFFLPFEQINCAIIPREGVELEEEEVTKFCKKNLAAFKVPKKIFITDFLPKTATGKIQRRIVSEHFLAQISTAKVPKFGA